VRVGLSRVGWNGTGTRATRRGRKAKEAEYRIRVSLGSVLIAVEGRIGRAYFVVSVVPWLRGERRSMARFKAKRLCARARKVMVSGTRRAHLLFQLFP
jgi:hypothetical protein